MMPLATEYQVSSARCIAAAFEGLDSGFLDCRPITVGDIRKFSTISSDRTVAYDTPAFGSTVEVPAASVDGKVPSLVFSLDQATGLVVIP